MTFKHENADVGAEADLFREAIDQFNSKIVFDKHNDDLNRTVIEYVSGEGDPPFIRYRLILEPVDAYSEEEYEALETVGSPNKQAAQAES